MILIIDNYDSFVYNLAHYLQELGREVEVHRHDVLTIEEIEAKAPEGILISPGPCDPQKAGISLDVVRRLGGKFPILGVCLGHQCIGEVYGGKIIKAPEPIHGIASMIHHDGKGVFKEIPTPFKAGRYHSLVIDPDEVPDELEVSARTEDEIIMAVRHREQLVIGVQFHPESILTKHGHDLLRNFLDLMAEQSS